MKIILGMCVYNKEQENIAKNLKIPVVIKKQDFKDNIDIFNHLFTETNKLCEQWDDIVVLINGCSIKQDFQSQVKKLFDKNYHLNMLDVIPNNISKKMVTNTTESLSGYKFRATEEIFNRFDIKIFKHFIFNAFGGINKEKVIEFGLEDFAFDVFNKNLTYLDKVTLAKTFTSEILDKNTTTVNTSIRSKGFDYPEILTNKDTPFQIYKKVDV